MFSLLSLCHTVTRFFFLIQAVPKPLNGWTWNFGTTSIKSIGRSLLSPGTDLFFRLLTVGQNVFEAPSDYGHCIASATDSKIYGRISGSGTLRKSIWPALRLRSKGNLPLAWNLCPRRLMRVSRQNFSRRSYMHSLNAL